MRTFLIHVALGFSLATICSVSAQETPSAPAADAPKAAKPETRTFDHVLLISVDGLRSDALIALPPQELPGFTRLCACASTLNARTDPEWTVTLPNHTTMFTGRFVDGPRGHAWTRNGEPEPGETLATNRSSYVPGIFDVAHDHGIFTALFAGKTKFSLYDATWNATAGEPDAVDPDHGRDKIDLYDYNLETHAMVDDVLAQLAEVKKRKLFFVHFAVTDLTAHASGWDVSRSSKYMKSVQAVDTELVRLLDAIESSNALRGRTAIVLTTDHGGGAPFKSHDQPHMWVDYIIPFIVWTGPCDASDELYALNADTRRDPGLGRPRRGDKGLPPIRNGDSGNLVLSLLGLPAVPTSELNAKQDLRVLYAPVVPR